jgi:hypothetical protein
MLNISSGADQDERSQYQPGCDDPTAGCEPQSAMQQQAPRSCCSRQAIDLHFSLAVDDRIKWDDHADRRPSMEAHLLAINLSS